MAVIESCEKHVAISNGLMVPNEHASEVSSNGTVSNNVVSQQPETKECLVQQRVSARLQNRANKVKYESDRKRSMSDDTNGNNSVQKKTKLNPSMNDDTCSYSSGCGVECVACIVPNYTNAFPHGVDLTTILSLKETLRLLNIKRLLSAEEEQNRSKEEDNDDLGAAQISRNKNHFTRGNVPKVPSGYPWYAISKASKKCSASSEGYGFLSLVCKDISNGQEDISIPVINEYDNPPVAPAGFTYIKSIQVAKNLKVPSGADGCECKGSCRNTDKSACPCVLLNGSVPYVRGKGGRLIAPKDVVFECGPSCGCGPNCGNRASQKGIKYRLEVYRTVNKGWAVRTWDAIPAGAPVCEYIGVLRRNDELDNIAENDYIFDIDCKQTINEVEGRERRLHVVSLPTSPSVEKRGDETMEIEPEYCIDAGSFGNVARFINHSCEPNLFVQCVLSSHHDIKQARVVLFAAKKIRPYQELTYDYGYQLDSVIGPDGKIKQLPCYCGAAGCRKRLY